MTGFLFVFVGAVIGAVVGLAVASEAGRRRRSRSRSNTAHDAPRAHSHGDLENRIGALQRAHLAAAQRVEIRLDQLESELRLVKSSRAGRADEPEREPRAGGYAVRITQPAFAAPAPALEPSRVHDEPLARPTGSSTALPAQVLELALRDVVTVWNALDWTDGELDGTRALAALLPPDWRVSDVLKHKYFLLYRDVPVARGEPMYLLPHLGMNADLFTHDFFDGPAIGGAERMIDPAQVGFCEHNTTVEQELAKLRHDAYTPADILVIRKKGQIA